MNIAIVGTGYVGLVTGTCFAETGNNVTCVDIDATKVERMKRGHVPIYEPGLEEVFQRGIEEDRLHFTTDLQEAVQGAQVIFLALPTPPNEDGSADLSYILKVATDLGPLLQEYAIIINKSTVPVGTAERVKAEIAKGAKTEFDVASNPEFLREGFAIEDFMHPDRVVIGSGSDKVRATLKTLYDPLVREGNPIYFMDERSAEMTKYAANSFLAAKISFMNEVANLCEAVGADVDAVRLGIGSDQRIGSRFLFAGIGYGGSCFPKDVRALQNTGREYGYEFAMLDSIIQVNDRQKGVLLEKINAYYGNDLAGKVFALWGLAFKPDTDDIREAPALGIIEGLTSAGATVRAFDPEAMENVARTHLENERLQLVEHGMEAVEGADALIVATEWSTFRSPDFEKIKQAMRRPVIFDGRNIYELDVMEVYGFHYESIGRKTIG